MNVERPKETPPSWEEEDEALADARARVDFEAGRCVPHEEVAKWLKTWGTTESCSPPAGDGATVVISKVKHGRQRG